MAGFCANCGSPLSPSGSFCVRCGARSPAQPAPPAAPPPPPPQQAVVKKGSSGLLKILIVVFAVLGTLALASGLGLYYAYHKVKAFAHRAGIDSAVEEARSARQSSGATSDSAPLPADTCRLLSKEEASRLIGEPIEQTRLDSKSCLYIGPRGLSRQLASQGMGDVIHSPDKPDKAADVANAVTNLMGSMAANTPGGEAPLLVVGVDSEGGRAAMAAMSVLKTGVSGFSGAAQEIPNLGDRAVRVGNLGLNVLKGNTMLTIHLGAVPNPHAKDIAVAQAILPRI